MDIKLIELKSVKCKIRDVWPMEESDFTPWLVDNLESISSLTNTLLKFEKREQRVGKYEADIVAKDLLTDSKVVIENQFEKSDHDHLGKCITYMSNIGADIMIWICEDFNEEHLAAIKKLNEDTKREKRFYAIRIDCFKVEDKKLFQFIIEEQPDELPSGNLIDYKNYATWIMVENKLPDNDLKKYFKPWTRGYHDFSRKVLPDNISKATLSMVVNKKGNHVNLYTYDQATVEKVDEILKRYGMIKHQGEKNHNLTLWSIDKEGEPDPEWLADTVIKLHAFLNKNI